MYCNNCGAEILSGSKFCKICGNPVSYPEAEQQQHSYDNLNQESNQPNSPVYIVVQDTKSKSALCVFSLILAIFSLIFLDETFHYYVAGSALVIGILGIVSAVNPTSKKSGLGIAILGIVLAIGSMAS